MIERDLGGKGALLGASQVALVVKDSPAHEET